MVFRNLSSDDQRLTSQALLVVALIFAVTNSELAHGKSKVVPRVEDELKLKAGDETNNEVKSLKAEGLIEKTESQAMAQLEKLLKRYRGTAMEGDLLFRKGELFMRRAKTIRFFELQRDSSGSHLVSPVLKQTGSSTAAIDRAIATYEEIQKRFPDYRDVDLVLFNQGFALHSANRKKEAEKIYEKILERHPQSTWVPDTLLALGDLQFEKRDFKKAVAIYDRIRTYPEARVYPYGIYKAGWSRYNLEDAQAALKDLEDVVVHCNEDAEGQNKNRLDLRKEALADMVLFFSEAFEAHKAYKYFRTQAGVQDVGFYLLKLSKLYERHARYKDVEVVLNEYLDGVPKSPERPQARADLIGIYDITKQHRLGANQLEKLYEDCKDVLSQFTAAQKEYTTSGAHIEPVTEQGCIQSTRDSSAKMAAKWHRGWLKNRAQDDLAEYSLRGYEIFLLTPREKDDVDDRRNALRFAYAELLFNRDRHRQAAKEYEVVARESTLEQTRHDANYAALVALEKAVQEKWLDPDEAKLKDLAQLYWSTHPKGKYGNDLKFKVAFVAYEKGRLMEAAGPFEELAVKKSSQFSERAQDLFLDILNTQKRYSDLRKFSEVFRKTEADPKRLAAFERIYQEAFLSEIRVMEESGKIAEAIVGYKKFAQENRNSQWAEKAWLTAVNLTERSKDLREAAQMLRQFRELFPKSVSAKEALLRAAQIFESLAQLPESAQTVEMLAEIDLAHRDSYLLAAADYHWVGGDRQRARKILLKYNATSTTEENAPALKAFAKLIQMAEVDQKPEERAQLVQEAYKKNIYPWAAEVLLETAKNQFAKKNFEEAFKAATQVVGHKDHRVAKAVRAQARMIQARILEHEFVSQGVNTRPERVSLVLNMKAEKLDKAQRAYLDVIRYGTPEETLVAHRQIAFCFGHFVEAVRNMSLGSQVSEKDLLAFKSEIEQLAAPMEEKQVEAVQTALKVATALRFRDGRIAEIQAELNRLNMVKEAMEPVRLTPAQVLLPQFGKGAML